jgi:DNA-binding CsgD family transcriptional regulator
VGTSPKPQGGIGYPPEEKFSNATWLLDEREKEMARLIALGSSNRETAISLGYSLDTVKKITTRIYDTTRRDCRIVTNSGKPLSGINNARQVT